MSDLYHAIRSICEDLVRVGPGDDNAALVRARDHLHTHCALCERALAGKARTAGARR